LAKERRGLIMVFLKIWRIEEERFFQFGNLKMRQFENGFQFVNFNIFAVLSFWIFLFIRQSYFGGLNEELPITFYF
jgi:hypothetical protein